MVSLTFYGGVDEIGGNKVLLEDGDVRVFFGFGQSFIPDTHGKQAIIQENKQKRSNNKIWKRMHFMSTRSSTTSSH